MKLLRQIFSNRKLGRSMLAFALASVLFLSSACASVSAPGVSFDAGYIPPAGVEVGIELDLLFLGCEFLDLIQVDKLFELDTYCSAPADPPVVPEP